MEPPISIDSVIKYKNIGQGNHINVNKKNLHDLYNTEITDIYEVALNIKPIALIQSYITNINKNHLDDAIIKYSNKQDINVIHFSIYKDSEKYNEYDYMIYKKNNYKNALKLISLSYDSLMGDEINLPFNHYSTGKLLGYSEENCIKFIKMIFSNIYAFTEKDIDTFNEQLESLKVSEEELKEKGIHIEYLQEFSL